MGRRLYRCGKCDYYVVGNEYSGRCSKCGKELRKDEGFRKLCEGAFSKYDNIVFMTGLNVDKRILNAKVIPNINPGVLVLTSNVSDTHLLMLLFRKSNFATKHFFFSSQASPFTKKKVLAFYGDGPYAFNDFVNYIYLAVDDDRIAAKLREHVKRLWGQGVWGWELLSHIIHEYTRLSGRTILSYTIKVRGGAGQEERRERLELLVRFASPPRVYFERGGDITVADDRSLLSNDRAVIEVPIKRVIPAFNSDLIRSLLEDLEGETAFVTIGGAEHNVYLDLAIAERREGNYSDRVLYDFSNVFDRNVFQRGHGGVMLATHRYVGVEIQDPRGRRVVLARGIRGSHTGGIVVKVKHTFEKFYSKETDLFVVIGSGPKGAIATKLMLIRLLCDDASRLLKHYGVYYSVFSVDKQVFNDVYMNADPVYEAPLIARLLCEKARIDVASRVTVIV